jgi:hypothetical protein
VSKDLHIERASPPKVKRYPFEQMKPGYALRVPNSEAKRVATAARQWVKRNRPGWKVRQRKADGGRVTRIYFVEPQK